MNDLRFAFRQLLKNPGFTAVAVLTLALGIGANTAIYSLMNKFLLRPLPVEEPDQLVAVNNANAKGEPFPVFSYPDYKDLRDRNDVLSGLIAYEPVPVSLSADGKNERLWGYVVTGNYFSVLGARPALGRLISADDDRELGAHPVMVVSYQCWQQRFGGDPNLAGRSAVVNGRAFTVIGVAPPEFIGLEVSYVPELWFPLMMGGEFKSILPGQAKGNTAWLEDRKQWSLFVAGRLKPGVSLARAQAALKTIADQLAREHPNENQGKTVVLSRPGLWGAFRDWGLGFPGALMGVAGLVLLLVCTNLANLLLVRALDRRKEIALRLALGASRARVLWQLLTESLLLATVSGAVGLLLAFWLVQVPGTFKLSLPFSLAIGIDWRVLLFAVSVTFVSSVAFGLVPAWQATKPDLLPALKDEIFVFGYRRSGLRGSLVGAFMLTRLLRGLSYGVGPTDPLTFSAATLLLTVTALLACWLPARRAAKVDPMEVLRHE